MGAVDWAGAEGQALRDKWGLLLAPLANFTEVHLTDPIVSKLAALAVQDKLLEADEAAAMIAVVPPPG